MSKTISEGFTMFHAWLTPTITESSAAKSHRATIESCLKEKLGMTRFFRTGSFGSGTSIRGYSDVDYFASIPGDILKANSELSLKIVSDTLDMRFPKTGVHVDSPAVAVPFGQDGSETTEIVPAHFLEKINDYRIYDIPNGNSGWIKVCPEAHKDYVSVCDGKLNSQVKPLIRFMKAWKYYNNVPISSFFIEMYVAKYSKTEDTIIYSHDIKILFSRLLDSKLGGVTDPVGISGIITPCKNETDKLRSLSEISKALQRATRALESITKGDEKTAFHWYNELFTDRFPSY